MEISRLIADLDDPDWHVACTAQWRLERAGVPALAELGRFALARGPSAWRAVWVMGRIADPQIHGVLTELQSTADPKGDTGWIAAPASGSAGSLPPSALLSLEIVEARVRLAERLGPLPPAPRERDLLVQNARMLAAALDDSHEPVRRAAGEALKRLGSAAKAGLGEFIRGSSGPEGRKAAIELLRRLGGREAIEPLCVALLDGDGDVRRLAALALAAITERQAVPELGLALGPLRSLAAKEGGGFLRLFGGARNPFRQTLEAIERAIGSDPTLPMPAATPPASAAQLPRPAASPDGRADDRRLPHPSTELGGPVR